MQKSSLNNIIGCPTSEGALHEADAWIIVSGSRPLLEWFVFKEIPVFALFGRRRGLLIAGAGPDQKFAMQMMMDRLSP